MKLTNENIIKLIEIRQGNKEEFHPYTCGNNSNHILVPIEIKNKVILNCPECDYIQNIDEEHLNIFLNFILLLKS